MLPPCDDPNLQPLIDKLNETAKVFAAKAQYQNDVSFIVESLGIGIWKWDLITNSLDWDKNMYQLYGVDPKDFTGAYDAWEKSLSQETKTKAVEEINIAVAGGKSFDTTFQVVHKNSGKVQEIRTRAFVIRDESGKALKMWGINIDRSREAKIERERENLNNLLQVVLDNVPSMIFVKDFKKNLSFSLFNKAGETIIGINKEQLIGKNDYDFFPKEQAHSFISKDKEVFAHKNVVKIDKEEINTACGKKILQTYKTGTFDENGDPSLLIGISNDITAEVKAQEERENLLEIRQLMQSIDQAISISDSKKTLVGNILKLSVSNVRWVLADFFDISPTDSSSHLVESFSPFPELYRDFIEVTRNIVFKKGIGLPGQVAETGAAIWICDIQAAQNFPQKLIALKVGINAVLAIPVLINGKAVGLFKLFSQKIINPPSELSAELIAIGSRIGQALEKYQDKIELDLERSKSVKNAKLASLGEMSAGIAHEINNPLAIISGAVGLLSKFKENPEKFNSKIETIQKSCNRIAKIVRGLKKFSRSGKKGNFVSHVLCDIAQEVMILTEAKSKLYGVAVAVECTTQAQIMCEEIEIEQVLVNLINNGVDAVKSRSEKWVKISIFEEGVSVVMRVMDSGPGIPENVCEKLFDPFFTTKPVGEGTGLGLSITKGILDEHGATIKVVDGIPNTCFEIRFPKNGADH